MGAASTQKHNWIVTNWLISHALAGGRSLAEVRDAAGHSSINTTSVYTHVATDDDGEVGDLFEFAAIAPTV